MNFSVYWKDDYASIVFCIYLFNIWSQFLKKILKFLEDFFEEFLAFKPYFAELIFAIDSSKLYFADQIFAIEGQNCKNKFRNNKRKKFCP